LNHPSDGLAQLALYQALRQGTDTIRLDRQAIAGQRRQRRLRRALNWLGQRMVAWGWHLQERYDTTTAAPAFQAVN